MGYPGAGKSFFARQFAASYDYPHLSEERIRYELFERPQFTADEADIITRIQTYNLEQLFVTKQSVVCEGFFGSYKQRKQLEDLAKKNGYRTLVVWLQTDLETSYMRASKRDRRSVDATYAFSLDKKTFASIKDKLERPNEKEVSVVISGKHAFKSQNLTVLKKIAAVYSADLEKTVSRDAAATARPAINARPPHQRYIQ